APPGFGAPDPDRPVGLTVASEDVIDGYILASIIQSTSPVLMDRAGNVVKTWDNENFLGQSVYLLPNGNLLRTTSLPDQAFGQGGMWGFTNNRIEEVNWDGETVWSYDFGEENKVGHHDIAYMPNGHILIIAFERHTGEDALANGLKPDVLDENGEHADEIWSEVIFEIDPATNETVWEWHVWDHVVQEYDSELANYGMVAENPGRININYPQDPDRDPDWLHINSVAYHADLDQIVLSPRTFSEFWIIDHSISTEEAAGPAGDLLFRWGNPAAHGVGDAEQHMYYQHDPGWIPEGYPGAGHMLVYDNGDTTNRPYSTIIEVELPVDDDGNYIMLPNEPTGPDAIVWQYVADPPEAFYSAFISSAQRLANGNTLIAEGSGGRVFEVTPEGEIAWEYYFPPATWVFRAELYDLSGLDVDLSQKSTFEGGIVWGKDCVDGTRPRLHEYLFTEYDAVHLFIDTHGDNAQAQWEMEACAEHGGIAE
ncbi:MAG: aryl-sulfate sulfotransferase, partial [Anaerolineae bacterium]|nr:aryl-sulfate sulfotransferase [Anaerolineae bacterium]